MVIKNKYEITAIVFLKTDKDQLPRIITAIKVCKEGELLYEVVQGTFQSNHYEFELDAERNIITVTT